MLYYINYPKNSSLIPIILIKIQLDEKMPKYDYFVACDFKIPDKDDLINAIKVAFEGTSMIGYYADLEVRANGKHIFNKIEEMIHSTEFGIYEISTNNQNVSLELGLAKGAKKRFYILAKKGTLIPSDLQGMDRIEYDDYQQLTERIRQKIALVEKNRITEKEDTLSNKYDNIPEKIIIEKAYTLYQAEALCIISVQKSKIKTLQIKKSGALTFQIKTITSSMGPITH